MGHKHIDGRPQLVEVEVGPESDCSQQHLVKLFNMSSATAWQLICLQQAHTHGILHVWPLVRLLPSILWYGHVTCHSDKKYISYLEMQVRTWFDAIYRCTLG